jgi:hypothetical protein
MATWNMVRTNKPNSHQDEITNITYDEDTDAMVFEGARLCLEMPAAVASANDLALTKGNVFSITGTTTINGIATANWAAGSVVILIFAGILTFKHNTAPSAGFAKIFLNAATDLTTAANTVIQLVYDGTQWQEVSRKVPA